MTEREKLRKQLIRHEGLRLKPYRDTVGKLTIGVGRNLDDAGISQEEAAHLLDNDLDACIRDLSSFAWFVAMNEVRQRAVVDMRFNLGPNRFREFTATIAALERADYETAAQRMLASKWASQVGGRARRLAAMVRLGTDEIR